MEVSHQRINELLEYDSLIGLFRWKITRRRVNTGEVAGKLQSDGYIQIGIDGRYYLAHRLAWFYVHKIWPKDLIDHINGIRSDNRLDNLRCVTRFENAKNQRSCKINNKTGYLGVCFNRAKSKYQAQIWVDGKKLYLGLFDNPEEAHKVYLEAKRKLHSTCSI